jgi:hypothetical protein
VRYVWHRHGLVLRYQRLLWQERKTAELDDGLTEARMRLLGRPAGWLTSNCTSELRIRDTGCAETPTNRSDFVGTIKGVGKIYQQAVIDAHSSPVFAKLPTQAPTKSRGSDGYSRETHYKRAPLWSRFWSFASTPTERSTLMNDAQYIGLDVHQATISVAVLDSAGKLVMEAILETKAATILQFLQGLRGSWHVSLEEGTGAAWLHDLLKPPVAQVLVCDPRKNALRKAGNKSDRIDARKLADLLRTGLLSPVYHGENGVRTLKELARSYWALTRDTTRVMNRLKALYRSGAIPCAGQRV